ncbi:DUF4263 domain-containing protein [Shewanella baltica]|nr:DUF4263 domain-containing protein [Shewanella baltica]
MEDFLCSTEITGNPALIEIKRPSTELLGKKLYRGDDVYTPSMDLVEAITHFQKNHLSLSEMR